MRQSKCAGRCGPIAGRLTIASSLRLLTPVPQQLVLDQLQPGEILRLHVEALERRDLVQIIEQVALERVGHAALDERDRDQPLAARHLVDLVERVGRVDDRVTGGQLELDLGIAELNSKGAALV